jgi:hypothetical protein
MIKFDVDNPMNYFHQEVKWTLAIHYQRWTLSALVLHRVHHLSHALLPELKDTYCMPEGNQ